jgi:hypothetical protein
MKPERLLLLAVLVVIGFHVLGRLEERRGDVPAGGS